MTLTYHGISDFFTVFVCFKIVMEALSFATINRGDQNVSYKGLVIIFMTGGSGVK